MACWGAADALGKYRTAAVRSGPLLSSNDPHLSWRRSLPGSHASENICSAVVTASRPTLSRAPMDFDLERIAFGSVIGVTGAAVAAAAGRECNQYGILLI